MKQMALRQLVAGSPLRTLCLLIAGQPADVFSLDSRAHSGMPVVNAVQQPAQVLFMTCYKQLVFISFFAAFSPLNSFF